MKSEEFSLQQQQQWRIYSLSEGLSLGRLLPSTCQRVCVYVIFRYLNPCGGELMVSVSGGSLLGGAAGVWASCYCPATGCSTIIYLVVIEDEP